MGPTFSHLTGSESFFEPAIRLLRDYCRHRRDTPGLSDAQFLRGGFQPILGHFDSGRDFVHDRQDSGEALARTTWFDALHSPRRADLAVRWLNGLLHVRGLHDDRRSVEFARYASSPSTDRCACHGRLVEACGSICAN
jgi:hypothetical protein